MDDEAEVDGDDDADDGEEEQQQQTADYYEEEETGDDDTSNNDSSGIDDDVKAGASGSKTTNEKKRKRHTAAEASTSAVANADTTQNGEKVKEVPCPLCSTTISTSLREDEKNLNVWYSGKCKLPWCNTTSEYWLTLAKIAVHVLDRFKPSKNGRIPKCEHGVEASLVEYKYKHIKNTEKRANDPNATKNMLLHGHFFFECGWYVKKDSGIKCNFGLAADVQGNYGKNLTKAYIQLVRQKRKGYVKQRLFTGDINAN